MSEPQRQGPVGDVANKLLLPGPAELACVRVWIPGHGRVLAVTIRTPSTTCTVFLNREDGQTWASLLQVGVNSMGGLITGQPMPGIFDTNGQPPTG